MPKKPKLTLKAYQAKQPGKYADGSGLYVEVREDKPLRFSLRYMLDGKSREMGLGTLKDISLADVRDRAEDFREKLRKGIDPLDERRLTKARERAERLEREKTSAQDKATFSVVAEEYLKAKSHEWSNAKHRQQWANTLQQYAYPIIGEKPVRDIVREDVLKILEPHWLTKNETMTRVRQRVEAIINYAIVKEYREAANPAEWKSNLKLLLPDPSKVQNSSKRHHPALDYEQMPAFMSALREMPGDAAKALRLTILTAARTSEVLQANRTEFDLKKRIWTVPASRMKAGIQHRVALSNAAIDLIQSIPETSNYLFPGAREGRPLSNTAMLGVLKRMERSDLTVHGFRSTFRDWIAEKTSFPARVAEVALAHQLKDEAQKAYQRRDLIAKRFELMEAWSSYCDSNKARVVRLPA